MTFSTTDTEHLRVTGVSVTDDALTVALSDGRSISAPLAWYPRLSHGTAGERNEWRFIGGGRGIHWPQLDEDISVQNLIIGKPSAESQASLKRWLEQRAGSGTQASSEEQN
jgi:hypothetical protein